MTEPFAEKRPGHRWTRWQYDRRRRRWYRHCGFSRWCTAVESVARGMKPKGKK